MRRTIILIAAALMTVFSASAQKKGADEINQLKIREAAMQRQIDSLCAVNQSNQVLIKELGTMVEAFAALKNTYKSNSDDIKKLLEQVSSLNDKVTELASAEKAQAEQAPAETANAEYEIVGDLCHGLALVKEGLLYGYVNAKGEYVIPAKYEQASSFCEGLARIKINNKWGFIDPTGKVVIQPQFEYADDFGTYNYNDMVRVKINGKWGMINKKGEYVVSAQYASIHVRQDGCLYIYYMVLPYSNGKCWRVYRDGTIEEY